MFSSCPHPVRSLCMEMPCPSVYLLSVCLSGERGLWWKEWHGNVGTKRTRERKIELGIFNGFDFIHRPCPYQWRSDTSKCTACCQHYNDVIMSLTASQITSLMIVYSTVYSDADQRKHQSSALLAFVRGIRRGPVNSPHKGPVTRKMFPFDDVIMRSDGILSAEKVQGHSINRTLIN